MLENRQRLKRPFLKWPGGKMRLMNALLTHLPERPILAEPFVGAGALFANTSHTKVYINDINKDLINLYHQLKVKKNPFIKLAQTYFSGKHNCATAYYEIRDQFNQSKKLMERACLFLYLNRHGYNGLCRYNQKSQYNVPFGHYKSPYFPFKELLSFSERLQNAELSQLSYDEFFAYLKDKEAIQDIAFYCDPPYVPLSKTASFTRYAPTEFTLEDQKTLANHCHALWQEGAGLLISNHDLPLTRRLYKKAILKSLSIKRVINCRTDLRQEDVAELLGIFD